LTVFTALQLLALVAAERWLLWLRDPEFARKWTILDGRVTAEPDRPILLVLGSSRTLLGLLPDELPACRTPDGATPLVFNYGVTGATPAEEVLHLRRLLARGVRPRWVLAEVLTTCLDRQGPTEEAVHMYRLTWGDLGRLRRQSLRPLALYETWCLAQLVPCFVYRTHVLDRYAGEWLPWSARQDEMWDRIDRSGGWRGDPPETGGQPDQQLRDGVVLRQLTPARMRRFRVSAETDRSLRELIALCRRHDIHVTLFLMPESSAFRGRFPPDVAAWVRTYFAALSAECRVPVIDARDWVADQDFYDPHHLWPRGARTFTARFGREVIGPLVEDRLPTALLDGRERSSYVKGGP
jgi:hypothetical protein